MKRVLLIAAVAAAFFAAVHFDRARRPIQHVVLITVDSMRADHLPFHGYPRPTIDILVQLSEEGFNFEQAYAACSEQLAWLKVDRMYDPLRSEPRFMALMKRLNFVE